MTHFTEKYFDAFIYSHFWLDDKGEFLFFLKEIQNEKKLHFLNIKNCNELSKGVLFSEVDFNKSAFKPIKYFPNTEDLFLISDTDNKEDYNIYKLSLRDKALSKVTHSTYTSISGVSKNGKLLWGDRFKVENGTYSTRLYRGDIAGLNKKEITSDIDSIYRFHWGTPIFSVDEKSILLTVDKQNKREKYNILQIDLETGASKIILPENLESSSLWVLPLEFTNESFLYASDLSGYTNVYCYNFLNNSLVPLTNHSNKNNGISIIQKNNLVTLAIAIPNPSKNITSIHLYKLNKDFNKVINYNLKDFEGNVYLTSNNLETLWMEFSSLSEPPLLMEYDLINNDLHLKTQIPTYEKTTRSLVHVTYKYLSYKSFDGLEIPAFLILPKKKLKAVAITAFYGGYNFYDIQSQIFAELGVATFSPAVRGSWGFGKNWENYIKGDLGGNEILDLIWGARFLENELKLNPSQIGLEGGSHGGYSVLRGLTLPKNFKGQDSQYPFGFGICWAGFADLVDFYKTSNIPDWLVNMLGPFEENQKKYQERSPLNYFEELNCPLYIVHGANDARVSPSSMEGFITKLKSSDKKYFLHIMEEQGHTSGSKKEKINLYKSLFQFLNWTEED